MGTRVSIAGRTLIAAALVLPVLGRAAAGETGEITARKRAEDPRLERRISLRGDRWYVGELCEHIARLADVSVIAHDRDGAADPRVIAVLDDLTVADAMNALRSLLSYEGAPYIWDRLGDAPGYRYALRRSLKAQRLAGEVAARVQADFEAECAKLLQMCRLPEDQLKQLAKTEPLADNMVRFPRVAAAWQMLGDALSPEMLAGVLRGEQTLTLPVADLPPSGRRFVDTVWSEGRRFILTPEGGRADAPEPDLVQLRRRANPHDPGPGLMIGLPHAGACPYAGGIPLGRRSVREHMPAWILDGDREADPREESPVPRPTPAPPDPEGGPTLAFRLAQIADSSGIGIVARLPVNHGLSPGPSPYGHTLARYLSGLGRGHGSIRSKWRGEVLLLVFPSWYRYEANQIGWLREKKLRRSLASPDGMSFHEVVQLAASLTDAQARSVAMDHPSLRFLQRPGLYAALGQEPGLAAQAFAAHGIPLGGRFTELIARKAGADAPSRVSAFRVVEKNMAPVTGEDGKITFVAGEGHLWWLELKQPDGSWRPHSAVRRPREAPIP